eukprot:jgi/Tetstr1/433302/TSEL_022589.t1
MQPPVQPGSGPVVPITIPTRPSRVFGDPYSSGRPLQFDRSVPWYIVEATTPVERPVTQWSAINHRRTQAAAAEASPQFPGGYTATGITDEQGGRIGRTVAAAVRESPRAGAQQRLTQAALGAHQAFLSGESVGHQLGKACISSSDSGSGESDDSEVLPGPGHYEVPSRLVEGPAFSMAGRNTKSAWLPASSAAGMPGPGQYGQSAAEALPTGPAYTMLGRPVPPKREAADREMSPGPGHYHTEPAPEGPAYTIAGPLLSPGKDAAEGLPGPGYYAVPRTFEGGAPEGPAFTLTGRPVERQQSGELEPGPGDYQNGLDAARQDGPAFSMAPRAPEAKPKPTPGPGDVDVPDLWGHAGQAYTFGGKPTEKAPKEGQPGPGNYNVRRQFDGGERDGPAYTLGALPATPARELAPGPGEYEDLAAKMRQMAGPAFSMLGRPAEQQVEELAPGPGEYSHRELIGRDGVAYTMGQRHEERSEHAAQLPGPGEYTLRHDRPEGPAYTMRGKALEGPEPEEAPGPGEYNVQRAQPKGPSYSIAGKVEPPKPDPTPAAGAYNMPPMWQEGPKYTLGGKIEVVDRKAKLPGPGEYRLRSEPDGPFFTIRPPLEAPEPEDLPGPGEYEAGTSGWDGPKYSMGGKAADKRPESDAFPGPGRYQPSGKQVGEEGPRYTIAGKLPEAT